MSAFGLVWNYIKSLFKTRRPINGHVLLFLQQPETQEQTLDVFLLPRNVPLSEVTKQHPHAEYIDAPTNCKLIRDKSYSVLCPEAAIIQPDKADFDLEFGPDYHKTFEIRLPTNKDEVTLTVQDQTNTEVWKYKVDLKGPRRKYLERNLPAERDNMSEADLIKLLEDLRKDDFEKFIWYLKNEKVGDIEPIPWAQLERAERRDVVDLMVQKYELAGAVEVMKSVLKKISRSDLVKKLSNISSGSADGSNLSSHPSTSNTTLNVSEDSRDDPERMKLQVVCRDNLTGTTHWQDFRPNMLTESANISYRFSCPGSGVFRCNSTGLMFDVAQEAELQYWTVQWDERVLQLAGRKAAGPLFYIQSSPEGAVSQLHLPYCETMDAPLPEGLLSVVHITDDGMSFLKPLHITDTHVVVNVPHLSAFGLVTNDEYRNTANRSINGQVLLFLQQPQRETQNQYLYVFLLPKNVPVCEVSKQHPHAEYIDAPTNCKLITDESYSLLCPEPVKIQPDKADFDLECGPNYHPTFELCLPVNEDEVTLTVQDQRNPEVWKYKMNLKAPRRKLLERNLPAEVLVQQTLSVPAVTPGPGAGPAVTPSVLCSARVH